MKFEHIKLRKGDVYDIELTNGTTLEQGKYQGYITDGKIKHLFSYNHKNGELCPIENGAIKNITPLKKFKVPVSFVTTGEIDMYAKDIDDVYYRALKNKNGLSNILDEKRKENTIEIASKEERYERNIDLA